MHNTERKQGTGTSFCTRLKVNKAVSVTATRSGRSEQTETCYAVRFPTRDATETTPALGLSEMRLQARNIDTGLHKVRKEPHISRGSPSLSSVLLF